MSRNASASAGTATSSSRLGKTSRPSTMKSATWARNASPSWKATSCAAIARRGAADAEADEVDGEEAAAADHVGGAEGERRGRDGRDRHEGADGRWHPTEDPRGGEAEHDADEQAEPELLDHEPGQVVEAVRVGLDPRDQPDRERDRHRVVSPDSASSVRARLRRMCVNRRVANTAAASVEETTAPSRNASSQLSCSKSACAATPVRIGAHNDADGAEQRRRHGDLTQPSPRRLQPALVQDRDEADDADLAGELGVVELDVPRTVRAEQHAEREEGDEHRQPRAGGARARPRGSRRGSPRRAGA